MRVVFATVVIALLAAASFMVPSGAGANETINYTYDELGRLVKVARVSAVSSNQQELYNFDATDNRTNVSVTGAPH